MPPKPSPRYPIKDVLDAVRAGNYLPCPKLAEDMAGRNVTDSDLRRALLKIGQSTFRRTHTYTNDNPTYDGVFDAYAVPTIVTIKGNKYPVTDYIKLKLVNVNGATVIVIRFHP